MEPWLQTPYHQYANFFTHAQGYSHHEVRIFFRTTAMT